jgi:hypothetical protein
VLCISMVSVPSEEEWEGTTSILLLLCSNTP